MRRVRVIPVLLLHNGGLVKSVRFRNYRYIGDPINAVRIFNEKEIDEIVILDIDASREGRGPDFEKIKEIVSEAFIPVAYGGGISNIEQVRQLFYLGIEKVVFNTTAHLRMSLLTQVASLVGSQSVVASVDVKKNWLGKNKVVVLNGAKNTGRDPVEYAMELQAAGAGEIFLNVVDRDGTYLGYDLDLIHAISSNLTIPLVACGGAKGTDDLAAAVAMELQQSRRGVCLFFSNLTMPY